MNSTQDPEQPRRHETYVDPPDLKVRFVPNRMN